MTRTTAGRSRLVHMPALDGLRGLAVAAVLLFHGGWAGARGGFLGVDVFFVLSGFLITSLLLAEQRTSGTIGLGRFWSRRARRLLPALLLVVAAVAAAAPLFDPSARVGLRGDALAALAYVANWRFVAEGSDYFARTAADSPLNHLWSLAIEEQFYLVWPLVVLAVARLRRPAAWVGAVAATGAAASAAAMVLLHRGEADVDRVYYGTDTRAHTVLIGAALAALLAPTLARRSPTDGGWPRPVRLLLGLISSVAALNLVVALALVKGSEPWLYEGGLPLVSIAAAAVIAHTVVNPDGWTARLLGLAPLRAAGRLSYGLYLWHWPLYLLLNGARTGLSGGALLAVRLAATAAAAFASDRLLERPVRAGLPRGVWARVAAPAAAAATALVVVAATTALPGGRAPEPTAELASSAGLAELALGAIRPPAEAKEVRTRTPGQPLDVLVLGDSVAQTLARGLASQAPKADMTMTEATLLGCGVARGGPLRYAGKDQDEPPACPSWPAHWSAAVLVHDPDVVLVVVGRWEVVDRFWEGRWAHLGEADFDRYVEDELEEAVTTASARGARVALATAPYYSRGERRDGGRWPEDDPARVDRLNELVAAVAARHPEEVSVVDLGAKTAKDGGYTRSLDGVLLRYDGVHFTPVGGRWLAPWLLPQLSALGPPVVADGATSTTTSTTTSTRFTGATTTRVASTTTTRVASTTTRSAGRAPPG